MQIVKKTHSQVTKMKSNVKVLIVGESFNYKSDLGFFCTSTGKCHFLAPQYGHFRQKRLSWDLKKGSSSAGTNVRDHFYISNFPQTFP